VITGIGFGSLAVPVPIEPCKWACAVELEGLLEDCIYGVS
jgi:hypothetical protein